MVARLLEGGQISLAIGFGAGLLTGAIGVTIGILADWGGGWLDAVLMRTTNIAITFPSLHAQLLAAGLIGRAMSQLVAILALTRWAGGAGIARARTLEVRRLPYIEAAVSLGAGQGRLLLRHILPNLQRRSPSSSCSASITRS